MARPQSSILSSAHKRILSAILELNECGMPATTSDLVSRLELAGPTSLVPTLKIIRRNGFLDIVGGGGPGKRSIAVLTSTGRSALGVGGLCVLGSIPAGPLSETLEQSSNIVNLGNALPYQPGDFLLIVDGRSMVGDGILPNDMVLLRPDVAVQNGEIAAVHVGDQYLATLKHVCLHPNGKVVTLKASNDEYEDITVPGEDIKIAGVFRGLIRAL